MRGKELGVIPEDAQLTARHEEIPAWDDMPEVLKPVLCRQMEVYAGFMEYTDHHVGRLLDGLRKLEIFDDTLVYYIIGDNGASAEGTLNGAYNEMANFNGLAALETPEFLMERLDKLGGPEPAVPLRRRLGSCDEYALPMDEAGGFAPGRDAEGTIVPWPNGVKGRAKPANFTTY